MVGKTTQQPTRYATAVAMATQSIAILAALAQPLAAHEGADGHGLAPQSSLYFVPYHPSD